jgi:hypothetical protein
MGPAAGCRRVRRWESRRGRRALRRVKRVKSGVRA